MDRHTAVRISGTALAIGLSGDYLLRGGSWGLGASIWVVLLAGAVALLDRVRGAFDRGVAIGLAAAATFAGFLSLNDTPELRAWNVLAVLGCLFLALLAGRRVPIAASALEYYVRPALRAAAAVLATPLTAHRPAAGTSLGTGGQTLRRSLVAVLVTAPLLLVFGTLLASADPVFERLVRRLFVWNVDDAASHAFTIGALTWLVGGYAIAGSMPDAPGSGSVSLGRPAVGLLEVAIPMGALTALFATFVAVQFRYLFGGEELIRATVGLSVAEYARRGFFELVAASGLVIPLVVGADWLLRGADRRTLTRFRVLAGTQLVLVGFIMDSAARRLRLYYEAFGLTTDRLLALAVMVWIGLTLGWFAFTVLQGRRERFPIGAIVGALAVLAALNVVNPQAVVARVNLQRAAGGAPLDTAYLSRMSADAVPTLVARSAALPAAERCPLVAALEERHGSPDGDWRAWSVSRARARRALTARRPTRGCEEWTPSE